MVISERWTGDWTSPVSIEERERIRVRPEGRAVMRQTWRHLLFLHFPVEPDALAHVVPAGCELDLFPDESGKPLAWVGVVLFAIERIRGFGMPALPGMGGFAEANVRTYVHRNGEDPSVLFLSLDGGPFLTRHLARGWYGVPYIPAVTSLEFEDGECSFESRRSDGTFAKFQYRPSEFLPSPAPGSLEFFLLERYQLLAPTRRGLKRARIWHRPYRPQAVEFEGSTHLTESHGIPGRPFGYAVYCDNVVTDFFPPSRLR